MPPVDLAQFSAVVAESDSGILPLRGSTNGKGVLTLQNTYGGAVTIEKTGNEYVFSLDTVSDIASINCVTVTYSRSKDINCSDTIDPENKKFAITFDADLNDATVNILVAFVMAP